jgi:hypothetical protein
MFTTIHFTSTFPKAGTSVPVGETVGTEGS